MIAEESGESKIQVQRYIRLTNLIPEILTMTDEKQLAFNTAAELSNLLPDEQKRVLEEIEREHIIPAIIWTRVEVRENIHWLCTGYFNNFGILAGYGGDILSPQAEVPFFYPCGVCPLVQYGTSIL